LENNLFIFKQNN